MNHLTTHLQRFLHNPLWYVAVVAALSVLITSGYFQWWLAAIIAIVWGAWLVRELFGDDHQPPTHELARLQGYIDQTLAYKTQIDRVTKATANKHNHFYIQQLALQLDTCSQAVVDLVQRLIQLRQDDLIRHDLKTVPEAIVDLERRLAHETNAVLAVQLEHLLAIRRNQLALLQRLQNSMRQTEIQLEHTLSLLGTIYSQVLISQSTNDIADYGRISASMDEEMRRLSDQLEALREVKGAYWMDDAPEGHAIPDRPLEDSRG